MTQQGRNMYECVTIDYKTLFVHFLVISVFVHLMHYWKFILKLIEASTYVSTSRSSSSGVVH
jgi:hypothetical protein